MTVDELRDAACRANRDLARLGLVFLAFGNASVVDRSAGLVAIKPSGVACSELAPADVVVLRLATGAPVDSARRPSSDTPTHLEIYRQFEAVGAVVHTHSPHATSWAQARREIPALGTTHADHFRGAVPVTRPLSASEIAGEYEANTGRVIVERFEAGLDPLAIPAVLVAGHGPFAWGPTAAEAVGNAAALEYVATLATNQVALGPLEPIEAELLDRHFDRKHGPGAYYGQRARRVTHR
jgi:L-ribulose-5-phosphate 4-epimerase